MIKCPRVQGKNNRKMVATQIKVAFTQYSHRHRKRVGAETSENNLVFNHVRIQKQKSATSIERRLAAYLKY